MEAFETINKGFNNTFQLNKLSVGVVVPIENYANSSVPIMQHHLERVKLIEELGFKALWIRDVPFHVPSFGDAGQTYDPFTYLGYLAGQTSKIALGISSIALPLHHPVHAAKSVTTIDQLSGGRVILGVASGDRYDEYPAMAIDYEKRGELFRDAFDYIRKTQEDFPAIENNHFGTLKGDIDVLPKATTHKIPMLITGYSQQSLEWNAEHGDGWMYYPRNLYQQQHTIRQWRELIPQAYSKPFMQPLYVDLQEDDNFRPEPIHLGFKIGANHLVNYFKNLQEIGVNHVAINLRFNKNKIEDTLQQLAEKVLPHFHSELKQESTV
ncbi:LLM class oxidoreductase [Winogradskyella sp. R77965]|uniref:LLM class oxidoreductase n=1 Tax=Winogradskyella sp. R77965 TaxID=3093872 RepID=UPI0037DDA879